MTVSVCLPGKENLETRRTLARWSSLQVCRASLNDFCIDCLVGDCVDRNQRPNAETIPDGTASGGQSTDDRRGIRFVHEYGRSARQMVRICAQIFRIKFPRKKIPHFCVLRFVPIMWILNLVKQQHKLKKIDSIQLAMLTEQIFKFRDGFAMLYVYDWVKIPLVYTQVGAFLNVESER